MADPYLGEIRTFAFDYAPQGWAQCRGQLVPIAQNSALFSLLGTQYGGDGQTTFALPDLQGRSVMGVGQGHGLSPRSQGEVGGEEQVTLTAQQVAPHTHGVAASSQGGSKNPAGSLPAYNADAAPYGTKTDLTMSPSMITPNGGGQPHDNLPPYLVLNYCIALQGEYPSRP